LSPQGQSARTSWPRQAGELVYRPLAGPTSYENLPKATEQDPQQ